jgi:hypothetical protein
VPEDGDRFGDLGGGEPDRRSAAERLQERDRTHPEPAERPPEPPRPTNRYAWVVGIAMLMGLAVLLFTTTLPNRGEALFGLERGEPLPAFAAPLATGPLEGPANICQTEVDPETGKRRPCPEGAGRRPACELRGRGVVNLCQLRRRPLILTFVFDRGADCFPQVDRTERVRRRFPDVNFATVYFSRKDRDEIREIVHRRRWVQPVAIDSDGQVANRYGVGGCPTTVFAFKGGRTMETVLANLTEDQLAARARRLRRQAERR